jgi:hypothetical protein
MSRMPDLLRKAADALDDGQIPLMNPFLADNDVTFTECMDMADLMAVGARVVAWALDNPRHAAAAFQGARMEQVADLLKLMNTKAAAREG